MTKLSVFRAFVLYIGLGPMLFFALSHPAAALSVSPVEIDYTVQPGEPIHGSIQLSNDTKFEQTYYVSVRNFIPNGEDGRQTFLPASDDSGLVRWIEFPRTHVTIPVGASAEFLWDLNTPNDATPGGHYAAVFFSTTPPENVQDVQVSIGAKIGVLFLVNVSGVVKESAHIESFDAIPEQGHLVRHSPRIVDRLPTAFETRFQNDGNVHVTPHGTITISNMFGKTVGVVQLNTSNGKALPGSIRRFVSPWDVVSTFAFGKYDATLIGSYGSQGQPFSSTTSFWVFPWRLIGIGVFGLLILILFLKSYNRFVIRSAVSKVRSKEQNKP